MGQASAALPASVAQTVHRAIDNALAGLPRMDSASVSLVLTPDSHTQLALHLKLQHGQVEAQAILQRGDFAALRADWGQLQSRLAGEGVRLAPLAAAAGHGSALTSGSFSSTPRERQPTPPNDPCAPTAAKKKPARQSGGPTVLRAKGREWWA